MKSIHTKLKTDGFESWFFPSGESDRCVITLVDSEGNTLPGGLANMAAVLSVSENGRIICKETVCTNGRSNIWGERLIG